MRGRFCPNGSGPAATRGEGEPPDSPSSSAFLPPGLEACAWLLLGLEKSFFRVLRIGKEDYPMSAKSAAKGICEKEKSSMRAKGDKVLLSISTPRGDRLGRRMPEGSRAEREE